MKLTEDDFVYLDDSNFVVQSSSEEQTSKVNMKQILENQKDAERLSHLFRIHKLDNAFDLNKYFHTLKEKAQKHDEHEESLKKLGLSEKMDLQIQKAFVDEFKHINEVNKAIKKIEKLVELESDLDLHPEAEELKQNLEVNRILKKVKEILKEIKK